jgi:DNA-binding response OmpR family regulator
MLQGVGALEDMAARRPRDRRGGEGDFLRLQALLGMEDSRSTILLVEDHGTTRRFLVENLTADGFRLIEADRLRDAERLLHRHFPDLVLIDPGLPDGDGLELLRSVRGSDRVVSRVDPELPLIVLSGRGTEIDRVRGFERGCDDYVTKPFSYPELRARIRVLLARANRRGAAGRLKVGPLELDPLAREVRLHDERLALSKKEYAFLRALMSDPTRVYTREELLRDVWGFRTLGQTRTLDSHACRLRKKLNAAGDRFVVNVWGVGYRLVDGAAEG